MRETYRARLALYAANPDLFLSLPRDPKARHLLAQDIGDALDEELKWPMGARLIVFTLVTALLAASWAIAVLLVVKQ